MAQSWSLGSQVEVQKEKLFHSNFSQCVIFPNVFSQENFCNLYMWVEDVASL